MPKDTKTLGNNKAWACESLGFVHKKRLCQRFDTTSLITVFADIPYVDTADVGDRPLLTGLFCLQSYKHLFYLHLISN